MDKLPLDTVLELVCNLGHTDTFSFLKLKPELIAYDIWKIKCQKQYPNKPYFNFWSGEFNFRVQEKDKFMVMIQIDDGEYFGLFPYLYESLPILKLIIKSSQTIIYNEERYGYGFEAIEFEISKQFIVIGDSYYYSGQVIGHYNSYEEALKLINHECEKIGDDTVNFCIIDLKYMIPTFANSKAETKLKPVYGDFYNWHSQILTKSELYYKKYGDSPDL